MHNNKISSYLIAWGLAAILLLCSFTHFIFKRLGMKVTTVLLGAASVILPASVFAASVTLNVSWPQFAQENGVSIETTGGTTRAGPYTSGGASNLTSTFGPVTLTDGDSYVINMTDSAGDGWDGGGTVTVNVDGIAVLTEVLSSGTTDSFTFIASPIDQNPPPTLCLSSTAIPNGAVTLDFSDVGVDWPVNTYGTQTFMNVDGGTTGLSISMSDSSTLTSVSESNSYTGNGDTAAFFISNGMGAGSSTFTLDFSANPTSFVDLCAYHINLSGGGDKVQLSAVTDQGTILTNPTFSAPTAPTYTISGNAADANSFTTEANGLLGVYFQAPGAERITRVELVWSEATGSTNEMHGLGIGQIKFDGSVGSISRDYGDAPASFGDASAAIDSNIYLGSTAPESETTSTYDYRALGDGNEEDGAPKKSTGVTLFPILIDTDSSYTTPITVKNLTGSSATLEGWIDFNHNGTFDSGEKTAVAIPTGTNGDVSLNWPSLPSDIARGTTFIRLKLTNDTSGAGEVEDHVISIAMAVPTESPLVKVVNGETINSCQAIVFEDDFDDLTAETYLSPNRPGFSTIRDWTTTGGGADTYAKIEAKDGGNVVYLGNGMVRRVSPSILSLGGLSFDSNGRLTSVIDAIELRSAADDTTPGATTEDKPSSWGPDEVVFSRTFDSAIGKTYRFYFTGIPDGEGVGSYIDGMMRVDTPVGSAHFLAPGSNNGRVNYAIEFTATSTSSTIAIANYGHIGPSSFGWCNPQHATDLKAAAWCTLGGTTVDFSTNEVTIDDVYLVEAECNLDYSDAPVDGSTAPNGTVGASSYGEAVHKVDATLKLGTDITTDTSATQDADNDSDDGITFPVLTAGSTSYTIPSANITAVGSGMLHAWIDFDGNGKFDADEYKSVLVDGVTGTAADSLTWTLDGSSGNPDFSLNAGDTTFARFRLTTDAALQMNQNTPDGAASDGEVEDYALKVEAAPSSCPAAPIPAGNPTAHIPASELSWDISSSGKSHILNSVTIVGEPYPLTNIVVPDSVSYDFDIKDADHQFIVDQGVRGVNIDQDPTDFKAALLAANTDYDVSHYLSLDGKINSTDYVQFMYDTAILSGSNRYVLISERNGNNPMAIEALDSSGQVIGSSAPITPNVTYVSSGVRVDPYDQLAYFTVYPLTAIAPSGTPISGIRLKQAGATGSDGGDGKVFILVDAKTADCIGTGSGPVDSYDYGDAPVSGTSPSSDTTNNYGSASHTIDSNIYMGAAAPDADSSNQPSTDAGFDGTNGDDGDGNDDDDGISAFPTLTARDSSYTIPAASITTVGTGTLHAWIDFDGNGVFDADEYSSTSNSGDLNWTMDGTGGNPNFTLAGETTTFVRFRFTSDTSVTASTPASMASNGEVEDYALTITPRPFSCGANFYQSVSQTGANNPIQLFDVSVSGTTQTVTPVGDTSHGVAYNAIGYNTLDNLIYGIKRTTQGDTLVRVDANGIASELGVLSQAMGSQPGAGDMDDQGNLYVRVNSSESVFKINVSTRVVTEISSSMSTFSVADFAWNKLDGLIYGVGSNNGQLYSLNPLDGEVKSIGAGDPGLTLFGAQFFDNAGRLYAIENASGDLYRFDITDGSYVIISSGLSPAVGNDAASCRGVAPVPSGTITGFVYEDDDRGDDYDAGTEAGLATVTVNLYNNQGTVGNFADDVLVGTRETAADGSYRFTGVNASNGLTYRIEVDTADTDLPIILTIGTTNPLEGVTVTTGGTATANFGFDSILDFGDAPDSYGTTKAANGAQHAVTNDVYLGTSRPDTESDGVPTTTAKGDGADENGILSFNTLSNSDSTYSVEVKVSNGSSDTATLIAWIDFDGNKSFDADEAAIRSVPAGVSAANITLNWSSIPLGIKAGDTYLRVRLTTDTLTNREPSGAKSDGEVEDYLIPITTAGVTVSGRVFRDVNVNGESDSGEVGVTQLPVVLLKIETDTADNSCVSTRTDGGGYYAFKDVLPGTYQIYEASRESIPAPRNCDSAFAKDPGGYRSTTPNKIENVVVGSSNIPGQNFGDIKPPVFEPSNNSQILPGNVLFYAHRFTTPTQGTVSFTSVSGSNVTAGWASLIYQDSNCNGRLDGAEGSTVMSGAREAIIVRISGRVNPVNSSGVQTVPDSKWVSDVVGPIPAGGSICLINKVYAPANVAANDRYQQTITADFNYTNAAGVSNTIAGTETLTVTDITTAKQVQAPALPATPVVEEAIAVEVVPAQPATPNAPAT